MHVALATSLLSPLLSAPCTRPVVSRARSVMLAPAAEIVMWAKILRIDEYALSSATAALATGALAAGAVGAFGMGPPEIDVAEPPEMLVASSAAPTDTLPRMSDSCFLLPATAVPQLFRGQGQLRQVESGLAGDDKEWWVCDSWDDVVGEDVEHCSEAIFDGAAMITCAY
jgi:hypothetical protein